MTKSELIATLTAIFESHPELPDPDAVSITIGDYKTRTPLATAIDVFPEIHLPESGIFPEYALMLCHLKKDDGIQFVLRVPLTDLGQKVTSVTKTVYEIPSKSM